MKDKILNLAEKISILNSKIKSEEATKQALILPLLSILGYDIFNPEEVMPEVPCDISGKGDKIDYIISINGKHKMLIECKACNQNLSSHISQLRKYFVASEFNMSIPKTDFLNTKQYIEFF